MGNDSSDPISELQALAREQSDSPRSDSVRSLTDVPPGERSRDSGPERPKRTAKKSPSKPRSTSLESRLFQAFTSIAVVTSIFDPHCGGVIQERSQIMAESWNRLAQQNPRVKATLEALMTGGAYGETLFVTAATLLPILRHHGLLPGQVAAGFQQAQEAEDINAVFESESVEEVLRVV